MFQFIFYRIKFLLLPVLALCLAACGGGGGGGSSPVHPSNIQVADVSIACVTNVQCRLTVLGWFVPAGTPGTGDVSYEILDTHTGSRISGAGGTGTITVTDSTKSGFIAGSTSGETAGSSIVLGPASHHYAISFGGEASITLN